jgi:predicted nucleotidyltransferase
VADKISEKIFAGTMASENVIISKIQDRRRELAEKFSVRSIGIFGSTAIGHENEQSDIDVLVELNEPTFDHYMGLKFRLEEILGRDVDLVLKDELKPRLRPIIEKQVRYV